MALNIIDSPELILVSALAIILLFIVATILRNEFNYSAKRFKKLIQENNRLKKEDLKNFFVIDKFLNIPIWVRNSRGLLIYGNKDFLTLTNSNAEKLNEISSHSRILGEKALLQNTVQLAESFIINNNKRLPYRIFEIPYEDSQKKQGVLGFAIDLKESEEQKNTIKYLNSIYQNFFNYSGSAVAIFDVSQKLNYYNPSFVKLWHFREEFLNKSPSYSEILEDLRARFLVPEQIDFKKYKEQALDIFTSILRKHEEVIYLPDGKIIRQVIIPLSDGGLLFSYDDQTDRLSLERAYNVLLSVQKHTIDHLQEAVAVFAENGRLSFVNPNFLKVWKIKEISENIHYLDFFESNLKTIFSLGEENDWQKIKQKFVDYFSDGKTRGELLQIKKDRFFEISITILPDGSRLLTLDDVTDSHLLQRALITERDVLEGANNQKIDFLKNVSYEIRSPLTTIIGYAELIKEALKNNQTTIPTNYLDYILASSKELSQLVDNIIILTKDADVSGIKNQETVNITEIINSVIAKYNINSKKLNNPYTTQANKFALTSVISLLVKNISDFSNKTNSSLALSFDEKEKRLNFTIKNKLKKFDILSAYNNYKKLSKELDYLLLELIKKTASVKVIEEKTKGGLIISMVF
ncbi:MAG: PAS-domain containing protein [Alphaproteobacteria bacterium]